jgi:large subunit ribosomal protein LP0
MEATAGQKRKDRKKRYKGKFERALQEYKNVLVVTVDNVGSLQLQKIRIALRGMAEIVMGKNTLMRMIMREQIVANPKLEALLPCVRGNMGLIFTNGDLAKVREIVTSNKVPAAAKSGTIAPVDVFVPAGPTGLDPGQTSFFQALNIATKIARGSIEIVSNVHLIKKGDKVTSSAVALLGKLDIKPFFYGVVVTNVYENGSMYPVEILDITQDQLMEKFFSGVRRIAAIGLAVGYPTEASIGHTVANGFKKLLALSQVTGFEFAEAKAFFNRAAAAPAAPAKGAPADDKKKGGDKADKGGKKDEKPAEKPAEEEEEEVAGGFGGLFGDDG